MPRIRFLHIFLPAILLGLTTARGEEATPRTKPNIVVILADDLGYGDVQCNNPERGKIPTPNIDRIAAQGMRFTDGHSSSGVCSPSRYTLLTGRYHWRTRLQSGIVSVFGAPLIAPDRLTIAGLLKQQGYRTAAIGKWHLGWDWPIPQNKVALFRDISTASKSLPSPEQLALWREVFSQPIPGGPTSRGFDEYFGTDVPNWPPYCFIENDRTQGIPTEFLPGELLRGHMASSQGPALPGWKLEPILTALGDRACEFITRTAARSEPFFLYLPLTTPHTPLAVNEAWRGRSGLISAFADLVMETDAAVGRVLDALEKSGAAKNTLLVFTSDNGCASYIGVPDLERQGHYPSGPLRGYKTQVLEGGHRVPFLVRWPDVVKAGSQCDQLVQHADLMATFAEIHGVTLPPNAGEDSFSLLPLLKGTDREVRPHAVNTAGKGLPAIRQGPWKLIFGSGTGREKEAVGEGPPLQLYNLADDLHETKNLFKEKPELVAELTALMEKVVNEGRSTAGPPQQNDVPVNWRRSVKPGAAENKGSKKNTDKKAN